MRRSIAQLVLAMAVVATTTGCPAPYKVWLIRSGSHGHPTFGLGISKGSQDTNPLQSIIVERCGGFRPDLTRIPRQRVWTANSVDRLGVPDISRFTYGQQIEGLQDSIPAPMLAPGCYWIHVYARPAGASTWFWVEANGTVRDFTPHEDDSSATLRHRHDQAELAADTLASRRCHSEYANARTPIDTERIDSLVPYDTTRFGGVSCSVLREFESRRW